LAAAFGWSDAWVSRGLEWEPYEPSPRAEVVRLESQPGCTRKQNHELVVGLVVPEARRARLPGRDDAHDAHASVLDQKVELLLGLALGQRR